MKRILFCLFFGLLVLSDVFSQQNILYRESYDSNSISEITVKVIYESIIISEINGDQIVVEISANNNRITPEVENLNGILSISGNDYDFQKGDVGSIYIYVPKEYEPGSYKLKSRYGDMHLDNLKSKDLIDITTGEGEFSFSDLTTDYFHVVTDSEIYGMDIENLDCSYFRIDGFVGDIKVNLAHAPKACSKVQIKTGKITLEIPANQDFTVEASSTHSFFINNYERSKQAVRDKKVYNHNKGGATIILQTFEGDITIGE